MNGFFTTCTILGVLTAATANAQTARYTLRYEGGSTIHVSASLPAGDGRLLVATGGGIDHLPNQWATFVRDLRLTAPRNGDSSVTLAGKEGWTIGAKAPVSIEYDVDLAYATADWPAGNEQSGRLFRDARGTARALFTVTKPLFVYTSGTRDAVVRFNVPRGWQVEAPWTADADSFRVATVRGLTENSVVVGVFPTRHVRVGSFDATVATPGVSGAASALADALQQMGVVALRLFPGTPRGEYLMTFFHADQEDGESYNDSAALTSPDALDASGMVITGNTVVHELLHHWFGGMMQPTSRDSLAWFTEGFTEYYANRILAGSGTVPAQLMRNKLANLITGYTYFFESPLYNDVSLAAAGSRKSSYRFGVYNGGWALAFSLDVMLRSESSGQRSLDDVVRLLFSRHGIPGTPLSEADILRAVSEVAGRDMAPFFAKHVDTHEALPIGATLAKLGFSLRGQPYAADLYLMDVPHPTAAQLRLRKALFPRL